MPRRRLHPCPSRAFSTIPISLPCWPMRRNSDPCRRMAPSCRSHRPPAELSRAHRAPSRRVIGKASPISRPRFCRPASSPRRREQRKKESPPVRLNRRCRPFAGPSSSPSPARRPIDARTVKGELGDRPNESAKAVPIGASIMNRVRKSVMHPFSREFDHRSQPWRSFRPQERPRAAPHRYGRGPECAGPSAPR